MTDVKRAIVTGLLCAVGVAGAGCTGREQGAPKEQPAASAGGAAGEALNTAAVNERLSERTASHVPSTGTAPSFVVDPAWPKPLPHNWIIGDVGGLFVDAHDNIWVYHRPRALADTDAGALDAAGKDAKGNPISVLGHPRLYGRLAECCIPAPSVLEFDKAGNLIQAWGGPGDPGFLDKRCRQQDGCFWPSREHGIYVDHNDFVYVGGNGQAVNFHGQFPWAPNFGNDSQVLKFKADGTFVLQIGKAGAKGPKSNDTTAASTAHPSRICRPT